jgi:predicted nucleotidyltransferase
MQLDDVLARLKKVEPALRAHGVRALYLFGSHARNEARQDSDVDVFVDPEADESFGFLEYMEAYRAIVDAVGPDVEVGYSTRDGLSPYVRSNVEREATRVF